MDLKVSTLSTNDPRLVCRSILIDFTPPLISSSSSPKRPAVQYTRTDGSPPLQLIIATSNFWRADVNYLVYKRPCFSKLPPGPSAREREREGGCMFDRHFRWLHDGVLRTHRLSIHTPPPLVVHHPSHVTSPPPLSLGPFTMSAVKTENGLWRMITNLFPELLLSCLITSLFTRKEKS